MTLIYKPIIFSNNFKSGYLFAYIKGNGFLLLDFIIGPTNGITLFYNFLFPLNHILRHLSSHSFRRLCSILIHEYHYANQFHIYRHLYFQSSDIMNNAAIYILHISLCP